MWTSRSGTMCSPVPDPQTSLATSRWPRAEWREPERATSMLCASRQRMPRRRHTRGPPWPPGWIAAGVVQGHPVLQDTACMAGIRSVRGGTTMQSPILQVVHEEIRRLLLRDNDPTGRELMITVVERPAGRDLSRVAFQCRRGGGRDRAGGAGSRPDRVLPPVLRPGRGCRDPSPARRGRGLVRTAPQGDLARGTVSVGSSVNRRLRALCPHAGRLRTSGSAYQEAAPTICDFSTGVLFASVWSETFSTRSSCSATFG
jgi:hypothetical protein